MHPKKIGLITYDYNHLKTEQVFHLLLQSKGSHNFQFYALPFAPRAPREIELHHRPNQAEAVHPKVLADAHQIPYFRCANDTEIDDSCDLYLALGAGILSAQAIAGKKIINCHPGIIPAVRGLDAFKWALYDGQPLGITLHYIDEHVDAGELISIVRTPVYKTDSIHELARRHYENEIFVMAMFDRYLENPVFLNEKLIVGEAKRRMPKQKELELLEKFPGYLARYGN